MNATIEKTARTAGRAAQATADWASGRVFDVALWPASLLRELPGRVARLAGTLWAVTSAVEPLRGSRGAEEPLRGGVGVPAGGPLQRGITRGVGAMARAGGWVLTLVSRVLDLAGVPELGELLLRFLTQATPLTGTEIGAAAAVLGAQAVRYGDVRVVQGGWLPLLFARNRGRAFTFFHTIAMPTRGDCQRANLEIIVHELVHVVQYERTGSAYIGQALRAQATEGYFYGDADGLRYARARGKRYCDFNREQQAQMVQDYFVGCARHTPVDAYEPYMAELRAGKL